MEQIDFTPPTPTDPGDGADVDALAWAYTEIAGGKSPEEVSEELIQSGWTSEAAERIAEQARKKTRHLRR